MAFSDVLVVRSSGLPLGPLEHRQVNLWSGDSCFLLHGQSSCQKVTGAPRRVTTSVLSAASWGTCECAEEVWPDSLTEYVSHALTLVSLREAYRTLRLAHRSRTASSAMVLDLAVRTDRLASLVGTDLAPVVQALQNCLAVLEGKVSRWEQRHQPALVG